MHARQVIGWRVALMSVLLPGPAVHAQTARPGGATLRTNAYLGVGYVASIPVTPVGISVLALTPKLLHGAGVYADVKVTTSSPGSDPYYLRNVSVNDAEFTYGDLLVEEQSDWVTIDVAMAYAITGEFAVYGGAGYSKETHYRQYFDDGQNRGNFGFYWVADPASSGTRINVLAGALARIRQFLYFQMGVESEPRAVNLGFTLMLAR